MSKPFVELRSPWAEAGFGAVRVAIGLVGLVARFTAHRSSVSWVDNVVAACR